MTEFLPGDTVIIQDDPHCPRLTGLHARYQGSNEAGQATIQIGPMGATVPIACLRLAEQHICACGRPFWRVVGSEPQRCERCQEEEAFDPAEGVTEEDIADWSHPERESGLDWEG